MGLKRTEPCVRCGTLRYPNKDGRPVLCQPCRRFGQEQRKTEKLAERLANPVWTRLKWRDVPCRRCGILHRTNAAYYTCETCKGKQARLKERDKSRRVNAHEQSAFKRDAGICCGCLNRIDKRFRAPHPGAYMIVRFPPPAAAAHLRCAKEIFRGEREAR